MHGQQNIKSRDDSRRNVIFGHKKKGEQTKICEMMEAVTTVAEEKISCKAVLNLIMECMVALRAR